MKHLITLLLLAAPSLGQAPNLDPAWVLTLDTSGIRVPQFIYSCPGTSLPDYTVLALCKSPQVPLVALTFRLLMDQRDAQEQNWLTFRQALQFDYQNCMGGFPQNCGQYVQQLRTENAAEVEIWLDAVRDANQLFDISEAAFQTCMSSNNFSCSQPGWPVCGEHLTPVLGYSADSFVRISCAGESAAAIALEAAAWQVFLDRQSAILQNSVSKFEFEYDRYKQRVSFAAFLPLASCLNGGGTSCCVEFKATMLTLEIRYHEDFSDVADGVDDELSEAHTDYINGVPDECK